MGMSPLAYLQSRRIARARQLLESSTLPFEEIVSQCGYEDAASFRKLFARQVGMTPREYRSRFAGQGLGP
jgi:transcriptional regulator GlxA family with amidase domain